MDRNAATESSKNSKFHIPHSTFHIPHSKFPNASYTKTVKVQTGTAEYSDIAAVRSAAATIAQANSSTTKPS